MAISSHYFLQVIHSEFCSEVYLVEVSQESDREHVAEPKTRLMGQELK